MKSQTASNAMLNQFRQHGLLRKSPSFFGKTLNTSACQSMLDVFQEAGFVRNQPSFFGHPVGPVPMQLLKATTASNSVRVLPTKKRFPKSRSQAA